MRLEKRWLRLVLAWTTVAGLCLTGCADYDVDMSAFPRLRDGQEVRNGELELIVGQTMGLKVEALRNGNRKEKWSVSGRSSNENVFRVESTVLENVVTVSGVGPGEAVLRFDLKGDTRKGTTDVLVIVHERDNFRPSVPDEDVDPFEPSMGGAGGALPQ